MGNALSTLPDKLDPESPPPRLLPPDQVRGPSDKLRTCHCEERSDEAISSTETTRRYIRRRALTFLWAVPIVQVVAFYPVLRWYSRRLTDGSDEPWGLVALGAALLLLALRRSDRVERDVSLILPAIVTLAYAVSYPFVPRLAQAVCAVTALGMTASLLRLGRPLHLPTLGLLLLSLPVIPSLQFFLGYPLRVISAALAACLLQMSGFDVLADGACLSWGHRIIFVDAPCSGIRMLWAGMFISFAAASYFELTPWRTVAASSLAGVLVLLGNVARCSALFFPEAGIVTMPSWCHDAAGLTVFSGVAFLVVSISFKLGGSPLVHMKDPAMRDRGRIYVWGGLEGRCISPPNYGAARRSYRPSPRRSHGVLIKAKGFRCSLCLIPGMGIHMKDACGGDLFEKRSSPAPPPKNFKYIGPSGPIEAAGPVAVKFGNCAAAKLFHPPLRLPAMTIRQRWRMASTQENAVFGLACLVAAAVPLMTTAPLTANGGSSFSGWPTEFEGRSIAEVALSDRDKVFAQGFPGRIATFTDGTRAILFRWVARETRKLHPASDCFRGSSYSIRPQPLMIDGQGKRWSGFEATRDGQTVRVRERIEDAVGREWTDVSSWYWAAILGRTTGPWFCVVVVEPVSMIERMRGETFLKKGPPPAPSFQKR